MSEGYPRLLGDIGGTHARWAWQAAPGDALRDLRVHRGVNYAALVDSAAAYRAEVGLPPPRWAAIGIATPVTGDWVRMTNHHWAFSIDALRSALGVERCLVLNDFTALALALPALAPGDLRPLGGGPAAPGAPRALLGAGTGLGVSGLLPLAGGGWLPISGEGGHVTLAAADADEAAVIDWLRRQHGHVSAERVLSGTGLLNLYAARAALLGLPAETLLPAEVATRAAAGHDAACVAALRDFASFLGNVAGNLVLTLGARGGVYLGGGVVPRLGATFDAALFRRRFEAKGRFAGYLEPVPAWLITAAHPALIGASRALDAPP